MFVITTYYELRVASQSLGNGYTVREETAVCNLPFDKNNCGAIVLQAKMERWKTVLFAPSV